MNSPLGLGGQRCLGTLFFASGTAFTRERRERLLEVLRERLGDLPAEVLAGATSPHPQLLVLRAVAPLVEPLMAALQQAWAALRPAAGAWRAWAPRIWRV